MEIPGNFQIPRFRVGIRGLVNIRERDEYSNIRSLRMVLERVVFANRAVREYSFIFCSSGKMKRTSDPEYYWKILETK